MCRYFAYLRNRRLLAVAMALMIWPGLFASSAGRSLFSIPAGLARETLKQFSTQSGLEVVYPAEIVRGVRTREVKGEIAPVEALARLLEGTGLAGVRDERTGAFSISRRFNLNDPGSTRTAQSRPGGTTTGESAAGVRVVLTGVVLNAATGRTLEGARVALPAAGRETLTDGEGVYRFNDLAPGTVQLTASYTGLNPVDLAVDLAPEPIQRRNIELTSDIYRLGTFVVAGEREGSALAVTLQKKSAGVKNVVSMDAFGSLGANPAEMVARLPGVFGENDGSGIRYLQIRGMSHQLNSITMDGNRVADAGSAGATREFQFTQVNADTIERVEVTKSPTPDMDADSIGGAVNFVSKSALDRKGRHIRAQLGFNYRMQDGVDSPRLAYALSYSEVFGGKFGVAVNYGHRSHLSPMAEVTGRNYEDKLTDPAYTYRYGTSLWWWLQTRWGGGVKLDYKLSDSSRFYVNVTRNRLGEPIFNNTLTLLTDQTVATRDAAGNLVGNGAIVPGYTSDVTEWRPINNSQAQVTAQARYKDGTAVHAEVGSVNRFERVDIDYNVYRSESTTRYPHQETVTTTARGIGLRIENTAEPDFPRLTQTAGPALADIASYRENRYERGIALGEDEYRGATVNMKVAFEPGVPAWIKAGLRWREQKRNLDGAAAGGASFRTTYVGPDGVVGINPATGINDDNLAPFLQPNLKAWGGLERMPAVPWLVRPNTDIHSRAFDHSGYNIGTAYRETPAHFRDDVAFNVMSQLNNRQSFEERIGGAYAMGGFDLGRLSVIGGLRVETTKTEGEGAKNEVTAAEAARRAAWVGPVTEEETRRRTIAQYGGRLRAAGEYQEVFPGLHFKYEPTRRLVARASYSTNIGRPSIGQLIPRTTINNQALTISTSNPSLKPQYADNFDVGLEYYFEPIGLVSATVFLKEIRQFIFTTGGRIVGASADNGFDGEYAGYNVTTQYNGGRARVRGFELSYQQQLTFLPGLLGGLGIYANYAYNDTRGDYGGTVTTTKVAGFSPRTANAGISYIRHPFSLRLQGSYMGRRLVTVAASPSRMEYDRPRETVDFKAVYDVSRHFSVYLDVTNIFAEPERAREFENGRPFRTYTSGTQVLSGINARF